MSRRRKLPKLCSQCGRAIEPDEPGSVELAQVQPLEAVTPTYAWSPRKRWQFDSPRCARQFLIEDATARVGE